MSHVSTAPTYQSSTGSVSANATGTTPETRAAALDFLARLAAEVSKGIVDLPCFPDVVVRIRQALADPSTTPEKTVAIVGNEPRLAARLLQMANSATFNPSRRPLTDLRSAITRLGYQLVQSAAVGYAVQQMKYAGPLRSIAKPLSELWKECVSVASISQAVAKRTTVSPDEAFLTGLLHGIGRLYIMVRAIGHAAELGNDQTFLDMVSDWHAPIGKAVLENWGFAEEMCSAVGEQHDYERRWIRGGELSDILITSVVLAAAETNPTLPADIAQGITAFQHLGLTVPDCEGILADAKVQLGSLHDALGG
jgi:HD-like signal output (HDOD) protein